MKFIRNKGKGEEAAQSTGQSMTGDNYEIAGLVDRAAAGDVDAFGELYGIYLDRIYRYVFHHVKDKMRAEDITEEVFVRAWKAIGSCKGRGQTFSSWLYRIAHNHMIDNFRSQRMYWPLDVEIPAETGDPGLQVAEESERQDLLANISRLPENQRQVILLKFIEGMDNTEIGQVMGKSQGAIRVLQMRALAGLRQRLTRET